jgi:hypothetical protein
VIKDDLMAMFHDFHKDSLNLLGSILGSLL